MTITVGSLCSGYEGVSLGLTTAGIEHRTVFVADPDPAATKVLAHHLPDVPNLGDITTVDWRTVTPMDLLTAGYPCQPFSLAGQRKGTSDVRHLWPHIADAVRVVRPRWVLLENVSGHRSLGFGRVLADMAALGYVGSWRSVRASDVGAAHRRERVFILAWREGDSPAGLRLAAIGPGGGHGTDPVLSLLKTPTAQLAINGGSQHPDKRREGGHGPTLADQVEHLLPTPRATDGTKGGPNQRGSSGDLMLPSAVTLLPTPTASHDGRNATANRRAPKPTTATTGWTLNDIAYAERWGDFGPAIARWEAVTGRHAPDPTEPGKTGMRLSPRFVEWLMGLPEGWVTDLVGKSDALRLLGNGVVPQQLAHALRLLA